VDVLLVADGAVAGGLGGLGPNEKTGAPVSAVPGGADALDVGVFGAVEGALTGGGVGTFGPNEKTGAIVGVSVTFAPDVAFLSNYIVFGDDTVVDPCTVSYIPIVRKWHSMVRHCP
jgi:hypothetical protein